MLDRSYIDPFPEVTFGVRINVPDPMITNLMTGSRIIFCV